MTAPEGPVAQIVDDARLLLDHAAATGKEIDRSIVKAITGAQASLGPAEAPDPAEWAAFETKYAELARMMSPVTAASLRATADESGGKSAAEIWASKLWLWTIVFAVTILFIENYGAILNQFFALDEYTSGTALIWHGIGVVLATIVPFVYGGLGAAAFLLRSVHGHLHARTFDPIYIPEYYSRMLLGVISGGAIQLLITNVADDSGVIKLSAAALAFIAGYNGDLLFSTVERLSAALLPKVGVSSMRRAEQDPMAGVSVTALIEQLDKVESQEAKEAIKSLLAAMKARL